MLDDFEKIIMEIGELNDNDGNDYDLDRLAYVLNGLLENATEEELEQLINKPYMEKYKNLLKKKMEEK